MAEGRRLRNKRQIDEKETTLDLDNDKPKECEQETVASSSASSSVASSQHWVQCELPDCLKWRILCKRDFDKLDENAPWFCHMNKNVLFSSCETPEEKYNTDRKLKRHGLQYKFSLLPEGTLVWARLAGYCKWPAIICREPASPEFVIKDVDGDPFSYHVEFLGSKHSVAWVNYKKVDAYGNLGKQEALETCSQPFSQISMSRFKTGAKKRKKKVVLTKKKKNSAKLAEQLQFAIDEADDLIEATDQQRLLSCKYRYDASNAVEVNTVEDIGTKFVMKNKIKKNEAMDGKKRGHDAEKKLRKKKVSKNQKSTSIAQQKINFSQYLSNSQQSRQLSQNKLNNFVSKEERLIADIQGLQNLEQEFYDDYTKFVGKKKSMLKSPNWHGVDVDLFQLYMAVQDKGGFNEVCANMRWREIVVECCDLIKCKPKSVASAAMTFYSEKLLPYEMYVKSSEPRTGTTKQPVLSSRKNKKSNRKRKIDKVEEHQGRKDKKSKKSRTRTPAAFLNENEALKELEEMENLLNEFADVIEDPEIVKITENDTNINKILYEEKQSSVELCFNDESQKITNQDVDYTQLFTESQIKRNEENEAVDCTDIFRDVAQSEEDIAQSQVVPQIVSLKSVAADHEMNSGRRSWGSEEDLFAEIDKDEQLLLSLLD